MLVGGWKYKGDFTKIGNILPDSSIRGHVTKKKRSSWMNGMSHLKSPQLIVPDTFANWQ
ncbi:hypothetical protein DAI22_06g192300 [Oryza sativa Japonica Group]|nr:hypothetical protein DAI22_06g192300 [Oryza sativa Japonica Group]